MLIVQKYDKAKHLDLIKDWAKSWNLPPYPWEYMPSHGWVGYHDDPALLRLRPLSAVFIRECENQTAIIDLVISAPEKNTQQRQLIHECFINTFGEAEAWAKATKIKFVMAVTTYPQLVEVAKLYGFGSYDSTFLWRIK